MLSQIVKVIISIILSLISAVLFAFYKGSERKMCMFAMLLSTFGDIFMTDIIGIGDIASYPGAAFFIAAHIVYSVCFFKAGKKKGYRHFNKAFMTGIFIGIVAAVLLCILCVVKGAGLPSMFFPILIYLTFIDINLCFQFSYAINDGGQRKLLIPAMLLFLISDMLVFMPMLGICKESSYYYDFVWYTYIPAQLLIIIFNSDMKKDLSNNTDL